MTVPAIDPGRWLLRCPVDDSTIAPSTTACHECGVSTAPLRALASTAGMLLQTAAVVDKGRAVLQVEQASALVAESENYLLDVGRCLAAAGAYEAAKDALERAAGIAPGRKDIQAELDVVSKRIDPTGWLAEGVPQSPAIEQSVVALESEQAPRASQPMTKREQLKARSREAWLQQDKTEPGSAEYWALGHEMTRIAIEIAALPSGSASTEGQPPRVRTG